MLILIPKYREIILIVNNFKMKKTFKMATEMLLTQYFFDSDTFFVERFILRK